MLIVLFSRFICSLVNFICTASKTQHLNLGKSHLVNIQYPVPDNLFSKVSTGAFSAAVYQVRASLLCSCIKWGNKTKLRQFSALIVLYFAFIAHTCIWWPAQSPWPQSHPAPLGWTEIQTACQTLSPNICAHSLIPQAWMRTKLCSRLPKSDRRLSKRRGGSILLPVIWEKDVQQSCMSVIFRQAHWLFDCPRTFGHVVHYSQTQQLPVTKHNIYFTDCSTFTPETSGPFLSCSDAVHAGSIKGSKHFDLCPAENIGGPFEFQISQLEISTWTALEVEFSDSKSSEKFFGFSALPATYRFTISGATHFEAVVLSLTKTNMLLFKRNSDGIMLLS